jgi:Fur family ferric uptake transcriptional regulator
MVVNNLHLKRFRKDGFTLYIYGVCSSCQTRITKRKNMERRKKLELLKSQEKAKRQEKADNQNRTKNKKTV